ncbi:hypothetical protein LguiB_031305 [Lonicera macranthoides]
MSALVPSIPDFSLCEKDIEPCVGQCFSSEEEAFIFYQKYANSHGFVVRRGRFINKNGEEKRHDFFCHREGRPSLKTIDPSENQRARISTSCGLANRELGVTLVDKVVELFAAIYDDNLMLEGCYILM